MAQDSSQVVGELFGPLSAVQIVELAATVKRKLPKEVESQITVGFNSRIDSSEGKNILQVMIRIDASSGKGEDEIYSGRCQVVGAWPLKAANPVDCAQEVSAFATDVAGPIVFAIARQSIADVLNKVGIYPTQWPWHMSRSEQIDSSGASPVKSGDTGKAAKKSARKRK